MPDHPGRHRSEPVPEAAAGPTVYGPRLPGVHHKLTYRYVALVFSWASPSRLLVPVAVQRSATVVVVVIVAVVVVVAGTLLQLVAEALLSSKGGSVFLFLRPLWQAP